MSDYDLFISYARADCFRTVDGKVVDLVQELKRRLELHVHPDERRRRFRVCSDIDDFELDGTVSEAIRSKIGRSRNLLLVCSTSAPASQYVGEEISAFLATASAAEPLAAYLDLQPHEAFPSLFASGAIGVDIWPRPGASRRAFREQLDRESHKIVARAWRVPVERVFDRFEAERRRQRRFTIGGFIGAGFISFAGIIATAGDWGLHAVRELPMRTRIVAPAGVGLAGDTGEAVLVGSTIQAWPLTRNSAPVVRPSVPHPLDTHVFADGRILILESSGLTLIDPRGGRKRIETPIQGTSMSVAGDAVAVVSDAGDLIVGGLAGNWRHAPRPQTTILRWAPAAFQERGPLRYGETLAWSIDGEWLATATGTGQVVIVRPGDWRFVKGSDPIVYETPNTRPVGGIIFLTDPGRVLLAEGTLGLRTINLQTGASARLALPQLSLIREFRLDRSRGILIGATNETLEVFELDAGAIHWRDRVALSPKATPRTALSENGETLLVGYFDAPPDLFGWTWRVFGVDVWTR